jgi:thioredoxin 1
MSGPFLESQVVGNERSISARHRAANPFFRGANMAGDDTVTITESNFDAVVLNADGPVLVDFWAEWCAPCKALGPAIDELATEYKGKVTVGKVNVDENPNVASKCEISAFPTLLIFKGGDIQERIIGLRGKRELAETLDKVVG